LVAAQGRHGVFCFHDDQESPSTRTSPCRTQLPTWSRTWRKRWRFRTWPTAGA